ncbi:MAG: hypothetical protein WBL61_11370 [Bryobacteraceae bacterium]
MRRTSVGRCGASACFALLTLQLAGPPVAPAQTAGLEPDGRTIEAPRPLMEAALLLEARYAKPVTYEDPVWQWRGDVYAVGSDETAPMALWLKNRILNLPDGLTPAETPTLDAELVGKVLDTYHSQDAGDTRFKVTVSRLGLHIMPALFHNAQGQFVTASTLLDVYVRVPEARRMASDHLQALCDAVTASAGTSLINGGQWFDQFYAAGGLAPPKFATKLLTKEEQEPYSFVWGATTMTARDALLSLLDSSGTTLSWRLLCQPSAKPENRSCTLNVAPLHVLVTSADGKPLLDAKGKPRMRSVSYDRLREPPKTIPRPAPGQ